MNIEGKFPIRTIEWSKPIEKNVRKIYDSCRGYEWMHIAAAYNNQRINKILMYLIIVLPSITTGLVTITTISESVALRIIAAIFGVMASIAGSIIKYGKFHEKVLHNRKAAALYISLSRNIDRQLSIRPNERTSAGKYYQWVSTKFEDIFESVPLIPPHLYEEWVVIAGKNKMYVPEGYGMLIDLSKYSRSYNSPEKEDKEEEVEKEEKVEEVEENKEEENNHHAIDIGHKTIRRTHEYNMISDLNKFRNNQMDYELDRMFNNQ